MPTPQLQLAGFQRVQLAPGASTTETFTILPRQLALWYTNLITFHFNNLHFAYIFYAGLILSTHSLLNL